jgi:hypothetical protein
LKVHPSTKGNAIALVDDAKKELVISSYAKRAYLDPRSRDGVVFEKHRKRSQRDRRK